MTDTKLEVLFDEGLSNTVPNFALEDVIAKAFQTVGVPTYTAEERAYAKQFKDSFSVEDQLSDIPFGIADIMKLRENIKNSRSVIMWLKPSIPIIVRWEVPM